MKLYEKYLQKIQLEALDINNKIVPSPSKILTKYQRRVTFLYKKAIKSCSRLKLTKKQKLLYQYCINKVNTTINYKPPICPKYKKEKYNKQCQDYIKGQFNSYKADGRQSKKKLVELKKLLSENIMLHDKIKVHMKVAAGIICKKGDNDELLVLLIQRAADDHWPLMYEVPRGKCDKPIGEDIIHCLKREVKEETGLDIIPLRFIDKFVYLADRGTRKTTQYNFLCKLKNPEQNIKLSKEHDNLTWITSLGEAELYVTSELKKTLSKVLNQDSKIVEYPDNDLTIKESIKYA